MQGTGILLLLLRWGSHVGISSGNSDKGIPKICSSSDPQFMPHPTDCHKYIQCAPGHNPMERICPSNLQWSTKNNGCDFAVNVLCPRGDVLPEKDTVNDDNGVAGDVLPEKDTVNDDNGVAAFSIRGGPSPNEGNVFYNGAPICDDVWDDADATVFCRMLGYQKGTATRHSKYGHVSSDFSIDNVECNGNEISLLDCPHLTQHNCGGGEGAGVICSGFSISGGPSHNEGNVFYNGAPICDDFWDSNDATVFCRMFGYQEGTATLRSTYGKVSSHFSMDDVRCNGNEISLLDCPHLTQHNCGSGEGAGVICSEWVGLSLATGKVSYKGHEVYSILVRDHHEAELLKTLEDEGVYDFWTGIRVGGPVNVMTSPQDAQALKAWIAERGLDYSIVINDVGALIELQQVPAVRRILTTENGLDMDWTNYHHLNVIYKWFDYLENTYDFCKKEFIGKSYEGQDMFVMKVCRGGCDKKPAMWIDSGIHAREWISHAVGTYMLNELVVNDADHPELTKKLDWYFLPCLNPDGYKKTWAGARFWRKTTSWYKGNKCQGTDPKRGTDANRNWGFQWEKDLGDDASCGNGYPGPKPFSEIETRNVRDFILKRKNKIKFYQSLHSAGQYIFLPWGYKKDEPNPRYQALKDLAERGNKALFAQHGKTYLVGTPGALLQEASGISMDWAFGVADIPYAYTIELRDKKIQGKEYYGHVLPSDQIIPTGKETWAFHVVAAQQIISDFGSDVDDDDGVAGTCSCSRFIDEFGYGYCMDGWVTGVHSFPTFKGKKFCYITHMSTCSDIEPSEIDPSKYASVEACEHMSVDSCCPSLEIKSDALKHDDERLGNYFKQSEKHDGRPVYRQEDRGGHYLFYKNGDGWLINRRRRETESVPLIKSSKLSKADCPTEDEITWQYLEGRDNWIMDASLKLKCKGDIEFQLVHIGSPGDLATVAEVRANEQKARNLLSWWTSALLDGGKITGRGFGGAIVEGDFINGPHGQLREKLIILSGRV